MHPTRRCRHGKASGIEAYVFVVNTSSTIKEDELCGYESLCQDIFHSNKPPITTFEAQGHLGRQRQGYEPMSTDMRVLIPLQGSGPSSADTLHIGTDAKACIFSKSYWQLISFVLYLATMCCFIFLDQLFFLKFWASAGQVAER
jgi:hypothetical protein